MQSNLHIVSKADKEIIYSNSFYNYTDIQKTNQQTKALKKALNRGHTNHISNIFVLL